eukprot:2481884-Rhodomonas_salina.1
MLPILAEQSLRVRRCKLCATMVRRAPKLVGAYSSSVPDMSGPVLTVVMLLQPYCLRIRLVLAFCYRRYNDDRQ